MPIATFDVRALREQRGLSRKRLADLSGLTESRVWGAENGKQLAAEHLEAIRHVLLPEPQIDPDSPNPLFDATRESTGSNPVVHPVIPDSIPDEGSLDLPILTLVEQLPTHPEAQSVEPLSIPTAGGGPERREGVRLISNSEIMTFKQCRRKWWLGWYRGLELKKESPIGARAVGNRVHRALKMYYVPQGYTPMDPRLALERFITEDWTYHTQEGFTAEFQKKYDQQANLERAMIAGYVDWLANTGEDADLDVIAPETYIEATIIKDTELNHQPIEVRMIGKLDVRVQRRTDGVRMFIDHKTVSDFVQKARLLPIDEQMLHYHMLEWLQDPANEDRCAGALYNMLRKVKRTPAAKPPFYERIPVPHNSYEINSMLRRVVSESEDILDVQEALDRGDDPTAVAYPNPGPDCTWKCDFIGVCPMFDDGSRVEALLEEYYRVHDPLEYYEEK